VQEANKILLNLFKLPQKENVANDDIVSHTLIISYFNSAIEFEHIKNYKAAIINYQNAIKIVSQCKVKIAISGKMESFLKECTARQKKIEDTHNARENIRTKHSLKAYLQRNSIIDARDVSTAKSRDRIEMNEYKLNSTLTYSNRCKYVSQKRRIYKYRNTISTSKTQYVF